MPMWGLILNDLIIARKLISWSYLFPVVIVGFAGMGNVPALLAGMPMVVLFLANSLTLNLFSREEKSGWRIATRSFPVTPGDVAASRFFVALAIMAAACLVVGFVELGVVMLAGIDPSYVIVGSAVGLWLIVVYDAALFPFLYRFGSGRMHIAAITLVGIIILAMYSIQRLGGGLDFGASVPLAAVVAGMCVTAVLAVACSVFISTRVLSAEDLHRFPRR